MKMKYLQIVNHLIKKKPNFNLLKNSKIWLNNKKKMISEFSSSSSDEELFEKNFAKLVLTVSNIFLVEIKNFKNLIKSNISL